jgi:hypothetical protein
MAIVDDGSEHGALYVANDGVECRAKDFTGLSRLGDSRKDPQQSTGNKGLGFRSVLDVTASPEIYSCASSARGSFDGYCFRFDPAYVVHLQSLVREVLDGKESVFLEIGDVRVCFPDVEVGRIRAKCSENDIDPLAEVCKLSPYLLPLPSAAGRHEVLRYAEAGFASLVRLPFKDAEARQRAEKVLEEFDIESLLFLDSLETLVLRSPAGLRRIVREPVVSRASPVECVEIPLREGDTTRRFWRWTRRHGGTNADDVERIHQAARDLPEKWQERTEVSVAAAVAVDGPPLAGRYFIDFGTDDPTGIHAHLNASFFGDLSREHLKFDLPLNALLREWLDGLVDDVVRTDLVGKSLREAIAVVDLVGPDRLGRYRDVSLVLCEQGWSEPSAARLLGRTDPRRTVTDERLRRLATFPVVDRRLDDSRRKHLERLLGTGARPQEEETAATVARVALELVDQPDTSWEEFWADVQRLLPNARALADHTVLLDENGVLRRPEDPNGPRVFFLPRRADESDGSVPPSITVPPSLRSRLAFLSSLIPLRRTAQRGRVEQTTARRYLDSLVHEYDARSIFRQVLIPALPEGAVALESIEAARCAEILACGAQLAREAEALETSLPRLRLPCTGGWFPASETALGPGWEGSLGSDLALYLAEGNAPDITCLRDRLLLDPEDPSWGGMSWLVESLRKVRGIADALPLSEEITVGELASVGQYGSQLPTSAPFGVPGDLWSSYTQHIAAVLEDRSQELFKGRHWYRLTRLRAFTGMASFDDRGSAAQTALMRLVLRSIRRWEADWRTISLVKVSGESHTLEVESLVSYWLRTKPWISFEDEEENVTLCTLAERWFVPALAQPGQKANFDHLEPLPTSVAKLIIKHDAHDALRVLGLRTFDPEDATHAKEMLDALAGAFDQVEPALRHIFLGQLRTLWQHFRPELYRDFPRALVVSIAGKQLGVVEPSPDNPVYLPDEEIAIDAGTAFGALPIVAMFRHDASRLAGAMTAHWGQGTRRLSSVKLEAWSGDTRWTQSEAAVPLMTSPLRWLAGFALAVAAFSGAAYGTQTERFRAAAATFRGAQLERVRGLAVQLSGATDGARHKRDALWEPVSHTLLFESDAESLEPLASPLQSMLARNDVATALRLALSKLKVDSDEEPTDAQLGVALTSVDVTLANLDEVRRTLLGDLPFVVARLRPVFALLVPAFDQATLTDVSNEGELRWCMETSVADVISCDWLLERCRDAASDKVLGRELFDRLGDRAELRPWNAALSSLGPPYTQLTNDDWRDQTEHHLSGAEPALHAIARKLALDGLVSFPTARDAIENANLDEALGSQYWSVPFREALRSRKGVLAEIGASPAVLAVFEVASDAEELSHGLRKADPSIDFDQDPSQLFADNERACETCIDVLQGIAAVHWERGKTNLPAWVRGPSAFRAAIEKELQEGLGYLERMDDLAVFALVRKHLPRSSDQGAFWSAIDDASNPSSLALALDVTEADRAKASDTIAADRERQRKSARSIQVCGSSFDPDESNLNQLWNHIRAQIAEANIEQVDLLDLAALDEMKKRKRPKQEGRPAGKKGTHRVKRLPEHVRDVIGLAGEIHVYRALLATFGSEVVTPACWRSSLSLRCFSTNTVDDGAGYDFAVSKGKRRFFLEVKSTSEPPTEEDEVELGVSELRCAEQKKNKKSHVFRIVRVFDALSTRPQIIVLPNPRDNDAQHLYEIQDANYRLRFRRARMNLGGGLIE